MSADAKSGAVENVEPWCPNCQDRSPQCMACAGEGYARAQRRPPSVQSGQLPPGMEHCTILFRECLRGHGRLTASNWIDHDCWKCALDSAELDLRKLREEREV